MPLQESSFFKAIILISLVFFLVAVGLIFLVIIHNQRKKLHAKEKLSMRQKFEAELLKTQIEVQEQTMQTIASDLHDNIGQLLSLTALTLSSIDIQLAKKAEKKVGDSLLLVNKSIKELRELAKLLHGEQMLTLGLAHALQQEVNWIKRTGTYHLKFNHHLHELKTTSPNKDLIILRMLQEIFNNIIKHAQASQIEIDAYLANELFHLYVKEDGIGFDYNTIKSENLGMGLSSLHKRVILLNGTIHIDSTPEQGTAITIQIPYP